MDESQYCPLCEQSETRIEILSAGMAAAIKQRDEALAKVAELEGELSEFTSRPIRAALQAEGKHPSPCARFCEAKAYQIEGRRLSDKVEALEASTITHDEWYELNNKYSEASDKIVGLALQNQALREALERIANDDDVLEGSTNYELWPHNVAKAALNQPNLAAGILAEHDAKLLRKTFDKIIDKFDHFAVPFTLSELRKQAARAVKELEKQS